MTENSEPSEPPRRRDRPRSFLVSAAEKIAMVLLAGFALILLFRGCVEPILRQDVGEVQQKHHDGRR